MASLAGRIMSAAQGAWSGAREGWAGGSTFDAYNPLTYDTYASRSARYNTNMGYYENTVYGILLGQVTGNKAAASLYKFIRGIRNPVARLVNLQVAKIYGGALDMETGTEGAIPLATVDDRLAQAVITLWRDSNWGMHKNLFVRHGAIFGDNFIKLVDDYDDQQICMEILHPGKVAEFKRNYSGEIEYARIEYIVEKSATNPERYEYTEIITEETFETLKDGKRYDYKLGMYGNGGLYPNDYGFVPVSQVQHSALGSQSGASCFHTSRSKIDEMNHLTSMLNDQISKVINPIWVASGMGGNDTISLTQTARDTIPIVKLSSKDATLSAMVNQLDIVGTLQNIQALEAELEADMPELALHRMREGQTPSGVAVHMLWGDASDRIQEAASNYDDALTRAQSMGIAMGALRGYKGYEGFSIDDYENGNLVHTIKNRSMFDETLDLQSQINTLVQVNGLPSELQRVILAKMDLDEATIDKIVAQADEQSQQDMQMAARGFMSGMNGQGNGDPQQSPQDAAKAQAEKNAKAIERKNLAANNS